MKKTRDLKKGTRIFQRNGWEATLLDNARGTTRLAKVYGDMTESGSIYSYDIVAYLDTESNEWRNDIEYTQVEEQLRLNNRLIGF